MPTDPGAKRVELILQQLEQLPTLPTIAVRVLELAGRESASLGELVKMLEADGPLTARILQLANRADRGTPEVTSVARAVSLLGMDAVRNAVLALSTFAVFPDHSESNTTGAGFDRHAFWQHALAVACCAEMLTHRLPGHAVFGGAGKRPGTGMLTPSLAFTAGLLHDVGKIALDTLLPKSFARVVEGTDLLRGNIADLERSVIGLDHQLVGKRLAERWHLPACFRDVIWLHGQTPTALSSATPHGTLVAIVSLADLIVREHHLGYSGNYALPPREMWADSLGFSPAQLEKVEHDLVRAIEPRAGVLGLDRTTTVELYQQALAQANRELGQLGEKLASRNQRLARRAKVFDVLSHFQAELQTDTPVTGVLALIAAGASTLLVPPADESAAAVCLPVAGFSAPLQKGAAAAIVVDNAAGTVIQTSSIDNTSPIEEVSGGPILPVSQPLEWIASVVSPRLGGPALFWIPLVAEGECVGGVMWGAARGEATRLGPMAADLQALAHAWAMALRSALQRDQARDAAEQLAITMSQLSQAQGELLQSRMLVAVGEMAAGAAHELNNPLTVIAGRSQQLLSQLVDPKHRHAASLICEQSHRVSAIVTELMDFARPAPPKPQAVGLSDLVGRSLHAAKLQDAPADRTIEVTLSDVPPVWVDGAQVSAAVAELIGNAIQATDDRTGHIEIHAALESTSNQVALTIVDNGHGMDPQTLQHAFDPFFSAKPAGRRRGMGLAKAQRWVQASGGTIRLQSQSGAGTRSIVLLPAHRAALESLSAADTMPAGFSSTQGSAPWPEKIPA